ncbi:MAG: ABC transporter ATP-binding protein [Gammaproteobacteria bacterium]|nr:ABC transporter ATP-binding protein [Gammaproteobacteria bacterium]MBU1442148.1 ABC transporter ATP-binding protein [Gammaproteobacteria bacterium]MBU2289367.1 ABC transporter ATP-binding protein [Gammaproteobacteria bacterium]MBU2410846.1 ABC transporter ATP-binding protein [Gammaproteobacteria bacterium]
MTTSATLPDPAAPIMALDRVSVAYHGDIQILNEVSMAFRPGTVTGIIGPNGAGKSTALKTLYGFLKPHHGEIRLKGERLNGLPPYTFIERGVAFVPQNRSLFGDLSVEDNLRLGCWVFRGDKPRVRRALDAAYARFPILGEKRRDAASSMSGGQQRFLELARALALDPEVILLDEPTAMIAPRFSKEIYDFIKTLPSQGVTVILVDQNVRQCAAVSDYLYVLELGRNRAEGGREMFEGDSQLQRLIAEWLEYRID